MDGSLTRICIPEYSLLDACLLILQNLECVPANSWHKWLGNMESQKGWISASAFIGPGGVSPQPKRKTYISAKYHQWASVSVLDKRRKRMQFAMLPFICVSLCLGVTIIRKEEKRLLGSDFKGHRVAKPQVLSTVNI